MSNKVIKKPELTDLLAERTGFYKKNMKDVVDALADIVVEQLQTATYDEPVEIHISPGVIVGGRRVPEHESINPKTRETIITPEKVIPYAVFKPSIRQKLYVRNNKNKKKG